jgi:hypothetical protein
MDIKIKKMTTRLIGTTHCLPIAFGLGLCLVASSVARAEEVEDADGEGSLTLQFTTEGDSGQWFEFGHQHVRAEGRIDGQTAQLHVLSDINLGITGQTGAHVTKILLYCLSASGNTHAESDTGKENGESAPRGPIFYTPLNPSGADLSLSCPGDEQIVEAMFLVNDW